MREDGRETLHDGRWMSDEGRGRKAKVPAPVLSRKANRGYK